LNFVKNYCCLAALKYFRHVIQSVMKAFGDLKKNIREDFSGCKKIKIAILADSASQFLASALAGYGYEVQVNFDIFIKRTSMNKVSLPQMWPGKPADIMIQLHPA